jgi:hypothetical protein
MTGAPVQHLAGGWTPERIDTLHRHFALGMTAAESADALGGVSRNAVLCKRLRLGLTGQASASCIDLTGLLTRGWYQPIEPPPLPCHPFPEMDLPPPADARPSCLVGKRRHDCSWPLGPAEQPGDYRTLYCCAPRAGRNAYCETHADLARWRG